MHHSQHIARKIARTQAKIAKAQARLAKLHGQLQNAPSISPPRRPYFAPPRGLLRGLLWAGLWWMDNPERIIQMITKWHDKATEPQPIPQAKAIPDTHGRGFWTFGRRTRNS
jgi:hypothetical protein